MCLMAVSALSLAVLYITDLDCYLNNSIEIGIAKLIAILAVACLDLSGFKISRVVAEPANETRKRRCFRKCPSWRTDARRRLQQANPQTSFCGSHSAARISSGT